MGTRKSRKGSKKTAKRKSKKDTRRKPTKERVVIANPAKLSLSELQHLAKRKGIPFGGLSKDRLIYKIIHY